MGLERRALTGEGDYMECPQLHSSLWTTSEHFLNADKQVVYGFRLDKEQMGYNALDRLYRTQDGFICIACRQDGRFAALARAVGHAEWIDDPTLSDPAQRAAQDALLTGILEPFFAALTSADAYALLDAAGAPCEIARETSWVREALWQDWAIDSNRVIENRDSMYGHVRQFGSFVHLSATPGFAKGSAPRLGEHSRQILGEIGYSDQEINELLVSGKAIQAQDVKGRIQSRVSAA
jgi:crotonobetainyl-CoA:carnitine CoA-transferase CaiB-like acyl-CoA transferase